MKNNLESWEEHISGLASDSSFLKDLAQIKARALLKEISAEPVQPPRWTYFLPQILRNLTVASFELETLSREGNFSQEKLSLATRQFALAWEGLSKLTDGDSRLAALTNAAVTYELAGYQANAACLAKQIGPSVLNGNLPRMTDLAGAFLQRFFIQLVELAVRVEQEPQESDLSNLQVWDRVGLALAGRGFAQAGRFFLSGEKDTLTQATVSLQRAEEFLARVGAVTDSNMVRSIRSLLPVMEQNSTWNRLARIHQGNARWVRYLSLLARGIGPNIRKSHSISELWPSQIFALQQNLLDQSSKIVKMPTSAGKTRVAELAIVNTLISDPKAKCVYIAPYRALVSELEHTFFSLLGDLGFQVSSVIGTYESDDFEQLLVENADVLVLTPEKLDLLQRAKPEFLEQVKLFIMDEAQIADDESRGVKFELLLTRLKRRLQNSHFLFLSAVVPEETLQDFATWFNASYPKDVINLDWRPSTQRIAKFVWRGSQGELRYAKSEDNPIIDEFVPGIIKQREYPHKDTNGKERPRIFPAATSTETSAELALKFAELGPVLIFCTQPNFAKLVAKSLEDRLELASYNDEMIPSEFVNNSTRRSAIVSKECLGEDHLVTRLLRRSIALHYGNLPEPVRKAIEVDFRDKKLKVIVATNTLAQGVNLPIRTVIIHSCRRFSNRTWNRIPARDYWNIAGRAGRAGRETDGMIVHIVNDLISESDYEYYLSRKDNVEPVTSRLFRMLLELVQDRMSEDALLDKLDPEVLALLVEEKGGPFSSETVEAFLNETLARAQADRHRVSVKPLEKLFVDSAGSIEKRVKDQALRRIYSSTGLSTTSCEYIRERVLHDQDRVVALFKTADFVSIDKIAGFFLETCLPIPEMESDQSFGGDYGQLLLKWLSGTSITEIVAEFGNQAGSPEQLEKFMENFFSFRLCWGATAVIKIATYVLELKDQDISSFVRFFPSMTKFGVPNPVATWARSAGIPFREAAISIAATYSGQTAKPEYKDFLQWIAQIGSERLSREFALKSPILEDVSTSIARSSVNPLLKLHSSIVELLPLEVWVTGVKYENRANVALASAEGDTVVLVRDYDNAFDHNAISVQVRGQELGYISRHLAQLAAPDIDCGLELKGKIAKIEKSDGQVPQVMIKLLAETNPLSG